MGTIARVIPVQSQIREVRGRRVILDSSLAVLYEVTTRALNQAVRRNRARFPVDFAFQMSADEFDGLRSQFVISKTGRGGRRFRPWVFTEHGAIMAASVLNSSRAIEMSVYVVRAFVRYREAAASQHDLLSKLNQIERAVGRHDHELKAIFTALRKLLAPPVRARRRIGFR